MKPPIALTESMRPVPFFGWRAIDGMLHRRRPLHRIHHSAHAKEMQSNFGNVLGLCDRLFARYSARSRETLHDMCIGLAQFRVHAHQSLRALPVQPLER